MLRSAFLIGLDFGTLAAKGALVRAADGAPLAFAEVPYARGLLSKRLPNGAPLEPASALLDPRNLPAAARNVIRRLLDTAGIRAVQVCGLGVSATPGSTLFTDDWAEPFHADRRLGRESAAWIQTWRQPGHTPAAGRLTELTRRSDPRALACWGGACPCDALWTRMATAFHRTPKLFERAARVIEAGDWMVWRLTGKEMRSRTLGVLKGAMHPGCGRLPEAALEAFAPGFAQACASRLRAPSCPPGSRAGGLSRAWAAATGLREGLPVAAAVSDAHAALAACAVRRPGTLMLLTGASIDHVLLAGSFAPVPGLVGALKDAAAAGLWTCETARTAGSDMLVWFENFMGARTENERVALRNRLQRKAQAFPPAPLRPFVLNWPAPRENPGPLGGAGGMLAGFGPAIEPHALYRALLETIAFGALDVIESFAARKIAVRRVRLCGGVAEHHPALAQICADVTGLPVDTLQRPQPAGVGAAIHAAAAAGLFPSLARAIHAMGPAKFHAHQPKPASHAASRIVASRRAALRAALENSHSARPPALAEAPPACEDEDVVER